MTRRIGWLALVALAGGILVSCATKKEKSPARHAPVAKAKPLASPSPNPSPTPEVHYTATARVDGGEPAPQAPARQATPSPTPAASPSPSPAPTPHRANFFSKTWRKIFPGKPTPTPSSDLSHATFSVSTGDRQTLPSLDHPESSAAPMPAPTPILIPNRPTEGFVGRMWHKVFPKKQLPPLAAPPQWIGTIKLVNEREGYVLIDAPSSFALSPGETLNSVGNDAESGVLRATTDRNPPFFIADIVNGKPHAGDRVYSPKP
ncbi:MAG: hypothetical protein PHC88_13980 [Terrimicrobiaceae bacterium]|nr:hypothetical protein [Terrimicrobiaceae bacterium]